MNHRVAVSAIARLFAVAVLLIGCAPADEAETDVEEVGSEAGPQVDPLSAEESDLALCEEMLSDPVGDRDISDAERTELVRGWLAEAETPALVDALEEEAQRWETGDATVMVDTTTVCRELQELS